MAAEKGRDFCSAVLFFLLPTRESRHEKVKSLASLRQQTKRDFNYIFLHDDAILTWKELWNLSETLKKWEIMLQKMNNNVLFL